MDPFTAALLASVASAAIGGVGASSAANAQKDSANASTALQKDVYLDQRGLAAPGYMTGGAASNKLAALFGIAPQDYQAAYGGGGGGSGLGNPNGQSDQWSSYLASNPDVMDYWKSNAKLRQMYPNANDFASYHYANFGQQEGRQLPSNKTTQPIGGAQQVQGGATGGASNPLAEFYDSPYAKLATTISNDQFDQIKGNLGAAGKSISGAAEGRYAKTLAGNTYGAFGDYTNQLANLAGMNQTSSQLASQAGGNYAVNAGNSMMQAGNARANALSSGYQNAAQGVGNIAGSYLRYGQTPQPGQPGYVDVSRAAYPGQSWS
jgi:hypothetical protein